MKKKYTPGGCGCCFPCESINVTGFTLTTGTAQAGTSTTIQLAAAETFNDDDLNGHDITITAGTGSGQTRTISDYAGASDTATVPTWTTTPDNTSVYKVAAIEGGDNDFSWSNGTVTPDQNIGASHEAYQFMFRVDKDCTVTVEGVTIVFDSTNQTIAMGGNTESIADSTTNAEDGVNLWVYVCPDFIYVCALNAGTFDIFGDTTGLSGTATCLTKDIATAITRAWTITSAETDVTIGPTTDFPYHAFIEVWPETTEFSRNEFTLGDFYYIAETECYRGPRECPCHYGNYANMLAMSLTITAGFEYAYPIPPTATDEAMIWIPLPATTAPATAVDDLGFDFCRSFSTLRLRWYKFSGTPVVLFPWFGDFDEYMGTEGNVAWRVDTPTGNVPYPKPYFLGSMAITESGTCWKLLEPNSGTESGNTWSREGSATTSSIAVNDLTAGFTLAATSAWAGCSGGDTEWAPYSYNPGTSLSPFGELGLTTTVTWTV